MKKWHPFLILLLFSVLITSCSKKDDPVSPQNQDAVSLPAFSFKGPKTFSKDQYAVQTNTQISSANDYLDLIRLPFVNVQPGKSGNQWTWIFEAGGGATETLRALKNADGSIYWELFVNGNIYGSNHNNWKIIDGTTSADEKNCNWTIYAENSSIPAARLAWTTDEQGTVSGTLTNYSYSLVTGKKEIINRSDNSGGLSVYDDNNQMTFQSVWNTDGSGSWKSYTNGQETANGSWK